MAGNTIYHRILGELPCHYPPSWIITYSKTQDLHHIRTTPGPPVSSHPRHLPPDKLKISQKEFEEILANGTECRSNRAWSSPLYLVPKIMASYSAATIVHLTLEQFLTNIQSCIFRTLLAS
ncbi:unnamed protein product [Euphydryas editha]|uniref:Uncharacterized protein n=1 Tax=Euphydryas editha TaxID=104508 RepID=A0AAU9VCG3_EUPED|nr:unnamed protein product [Euphydryas editha]